MKTLLLFGLVLLCGQFTLSLAEDEVSEPVKSPEKTGEETKEDSRLPSQLAESLQNSLSDIVDYLKKMNVQKAIDDIPLLGDLIKKVFRIFSLNIKDGHLLKISIQENKDNQSLSVKVPLYLTLTVTTGIFKTFDVTLNTNTSLKVTTKKDKDGRPYIVVSECSTSPEILNISAKNTWFLEKETNLIVGIVNKLVKFTINDVVCSALKIGVKLVPATVIELVHNVLSGNINVNV